LSRSSKQRAFLLLPHLCEVPDKLLLNMLVHATFKGPIALQPPRGEGRIKRDGRLRLEMKALIGRIVIELIPYFVAIEYQRNKSQKLHHNIMG
jgi:hypothetical protein